MSGNKWWSIKVVVKFLSDLVIFAIYIYIYIFDIRLSRFNPSSASKILVKHFLAGVNTKYFWNIPKEKPFFPVRILNLSSLLLIFLLILV